MNPYEKHKIKQSLKRSPIKVICAECHTTIDQSKPFCSAYLKGLGKVFLHEKCSVLIENVTTIDLSKDKTK